MTTLHDLAFKYGTDKCDPHNYGPTYTRLFEDRRNDVRKVLEIGIGDPSYMKWPTQMKSSETAASLRMWEEYFPNAKIYGIDCSPKVMFNQGRIRSFMGDQNSEKSLKALFPLLGADFDLIVDDGSHLPEHQVSSARIFIPLLASSGVYVIEDVQTYATDAILQGIPYKSELIICGSVNDDRLIVIRGGNDNC